MNSIYWIITALISLLMSLIAHFIKKWKIAKYIAFLSLIAIIFLTMFFPLEENQTQTLYPTTTPLSTTNPPSETEIITPLEITVDDDLKECSNADYMSIQEAIDNAKDGDTIKVYPGTYKENILIIKQLSLVGIGRPSLVTNVDRGTIVTLSADHCTFEGFDLTICRVGYTYDGIHINSNYNRIINNSISDCTFGIYLEKTNDNEILNNTFDNNLIAILITYSNNNTLSNNRCFYNESAGISLLHSDHNRIEKNICSKSKSGSGIDTYESNNNSISNNTCNSNQKCGIFIESFGTENDLLSNKCWDNLYGIYISEYSNINTITENNCMDNDTGIYLKHSSNNFILKNTCEGNICGIYIDKNSKNNEIGNNILDNKSDDIYIEE